jgi:SAM-dependent methyltransferase
MASHEKFKRFIRSFRTRGVVGTFNHYGWVIANMVRSLTPAGRREREQQRQMDAEFAQKLRQIDTAYDSAYHLNTGGKIELQNFSIDSESKSHGVFYQAVFPDRFFEWIDSLNIEPRDYLFVDIGAGKGRALFLAQDLGFKEVIGVEFARELVEICKTNIDRRAADGVLRPAVRILHMDGLLYDLPEEPTVLFLNNPFGAELMTRMAARIQTSLSNAPRSLKIVYGNPMHDSVIISAIPGLQRLAQSSVFNTYEWKPMAAEQ